MKYLIWSVEHSGWWGPNECGYVSDPAMAGRYEALTADDICAKANVACAPGVVNEVAIPESKVSPTRPTALRDVPGDFAGSPAEALIRRAGKRIECGFHVFTVRQRSDGKWYNVVVLDDQDKQAFAYAFDFSLDASYALMGMLYRGINDIEKQMEPGARA